MKLFVFVSGSSMSVDTSIFPQPLLYFFVVRSSDVSWFHTILRYIFLLIHKVLNCWQKLGNVRKVFNIFNSMFLTPFAEVFWIISKLSHTYQKGADLVISQGGCESTNFSRGGRGN